MPHNSDQGNQVGEHRHDRQRDGESLPGQAKNRHGHHAGNSNAQNNQCHAQESDSHMSHPQDDGSRQQLNHQRHSAGVRRGLPRTQHVRHDDHPQDCPVLRLPESIQALRLTLWHHSAPFSATVLGAPACTPHFPTVWPDLVLSATQPEALSSQPHQNQRHRAVGSRCSALAHSRPNSGPRVYTQDLTDNPDHHTSLVD